MGRLLTKQDIMTIIFSYGSQLERMGFQRFLEKLDIADRTLLLDRLSRALETCQYLYEKNTRLKKVVSKCRPYEYPDESDGVCIFCGYNEFITCGKHADNCEHYLAIQEDEL